MSSKQIKAKLSECYKKRKSVLFYGKDDNNRRLSLAKNVHMNNSGILDIMEYVGNKKEPNGNKSFTLTVSYADNKKSSSMLERITNRIIESLSLSN